MALQKLHCIILISINFRSLKAYQNRLSSFTLRRAESGNLSQALATPSNRFLQKCVHSEHIRHIPSSLIYTDKSEMLGEGSFGTCIKGYMQGNPVCLKHLKSPTREHFMHEASTLASLRHYSVSFLHGVQCEVEPHYLVLNIYLIDGYSMTRYPQKLIQNKKL